MRDAPEVAKADWDGNIGSTDAIPLTPAMTHAVGVDGVAVDQQGPTISKMETVQTGWTAEQERAAIVAWLREQVISFEIEAMRQGKRVGRLAIGYAEAADNIERGAHLGESKG